MALARCSIGKATSSIITVVPVRRTAPTAGNRPLRTFHNRFEFFRVGGECDGPHRDRPAQAAPDGGDLLLQRADSARVSISRAVAAGPGRPDTTGMPGLSSTEAERRGPSVPRRPPAAAAAAGRRGRRGDVGETE